MRCEQLNLLLTAGRLQNFQYQLHTPLGTCHYRGKVIDGDYPDQPLLQIGFSPESIFTSNKGFSYDKGQRGKSEPTIFRDVKRRSL